MHFIAVKVNVAKIPCKDYLTAAVMTLAVTYLLVCEGWRAVSHEPEDHLQSSLAAMAPLPGKYKSIGQTNAQTDQKEKLNTRQCEVLTL